MKLLWISPLLEISFTLEVKQTPCFWHCYIIFFIRPARWHLRSAVCWCLFHRCLSYKQTRFYWPSLHTEIHCSYLLSESSSFALLNFLFQTSGKTCSLNQVVSLAYTNDVCWALIEWKQNRPLTLPRLVVSDSWSIVLVRAARAAEQFFHLPKEATLQETKSSSQTVLLLHEKTEDIKRRSLKFLIIRLTNFIFSVPFVLLSFCFSGYVHHSLSGCFSNWDFVLLAGNCLTFLIVLTSFAKLSQMSHPKQIKYT